MQRLEGLVLAAKDGDPAAFGVIYEELFERVYRYVAARVGRGPEAEDIAQEVFLKAMRALPGYRQRGRPFVAWLFRIAHNLVVDRVRRARAAGVTLPLESAAGVEGRDNVEETALLSLDVEGVRRALGHVTELQRQVVLLRFIAELSLAETAEVMQRSENAVKALQHSALGSLRRLLLPTTARPGAGV